MLGGEGYLTASVVWPTVRMLCCELKTKEIPSVIDKSNLQAFQDELLADIQQRWDNIAMSLKLATYFDPRFKNLSYILQFNLTFADGLHLQVEIY